MTLARVYNVDSNSTTGITIGSTTPGSEFPILWGSVPTTGEFNISAVRVATYSGSSASYPSNGTITFRLRRVSSTFSAGLQGGTGTAYPAGQSTMTAQSVWYYSTWTNATGTFATMTGAPLWEQTIPCTAGANWGEWFTPGFEINVGAGVGGTIALTYTYGAAGTSSAVNLTAGLVITE